MKAIIMAGGKGTRLRPLTCEVPKPMVPVLNIPLMEHIILLLKKHGIEDIGVTLMYQPQNIKNYFGDGSHWGVRLTYFTEESPMGTAGSILHAASFLDDTFVVISGDCITNVNLSEAIEFHQFKQGIATLILARVDYPLDYGIVTTDHGSYITGFLEKPTRSEVFTDTVNTGIYILEPDVLKYIRPNLPFDFSRDLFPKLLDDGLPLVGYTTYHYWSDVGSIESYMNTHREIFDQKWGRPESKRGRSENVFIGKSSIIEPSAVISGPCVIGDNCYIGHEAVIDSYTVIGDNCIVESQSSLKRSILMNNCTVGIGCELRGSILGRKVRFMHYVSAYENTVIGDESIIHERSIIKPNIRIWPGKIVDSFSVIDRNIVWVTRYNPSLFHSGGMSGVVNVDITPEFASRLGSAYGSTIGQGNSVIVSSDISNTSNLFKYAFISGVMSVGVQVYNLDDASTPLSRQAVHMLHVAGGVHIRRSYNSVDKLEIHFLDETGANCDSFLEKKIENTFYREDFLRCRASSIMDIRYIGTFQQYYIQYLYSRTNVECFRKNPPTVLILSNCEWMLTFVGSVFEQLGIPIAGEMLVEQLDPDKLKNVKHFLQADITAYIDCNGEKLVLLDPGGKTIDENRFFLLNAYMLFKSISGYNIVAPMNMTMALERLAAKYGGGVKWEKTSPYAILRCLMRTDVYADTMNQYMLQYDGVASLVKLIEFLCIHHTSLDNLLKFIPDYYLKHTSILCPYELIGKVMRELKKSSQNQRHDGIKIYLENAWVFIIPDAEKPFLHLHAEGGSYKEVSRLVSEHQAFLENLISSLKN